MHHDEHIDWPVLIVKNAGGGIMMGCLELSRFRAGSAGDVDVAGRGVELIGGVGDM
jgi:hypothetical protein